eukprot:6306698-Prymnesium_polylepis.1
MPDQVFGQLLKHFRQHRLAQSHQRLPEPVCGPFTCGSRGERRVPPGGAARAGGGCGPFAGR